MGCPNEINEQQRTPDAGSAPVRASAHELALPFSGCTAAADRQVDVCVGARRSRDDWKLPIATGLRGK